MLEFLRHLFSTDGFVPRWNCGDWSEGHGWLHVASDTMVFAAYFAIPLGIWYFVALKKHQLPFSLLFVLFGTFILSCGLTHLIDATLFWQPWYRFSGLMKLITALTSWATVIALFRNMPRALALPGIEEMNKNLQAEIAQRQAAECEREALLLAERSARETAEDASRSKDEFVAMLSHELRTPLSAILGYTTLAREEAPPASEIAAHLEVIDRNAQAQKRLIEDLLDTNRIMAGKLRLDVQLMDLGAVVESALDTLRPQAMIKGVRLGKVTDGSAVSVRGDPARMQQIVWNLVSNAIKFTPSGGRIDVRVERVNSHVEVSVEDTGIGIPEEALSSIFDRFKQVDSSSTRRHGGLGLGLAIAKSLVEMHGGSIVAKSLGAGKGSTFRVALPLPAVHTEAGDTQRRHPHAAPPVKAEAVLPSLEGVKILAVDDDHDARELLRRMLGQSGATVTVAKSAEEALRAASMQRFDVLISDIGMPDMNGLELISALRTHLEGPNSNIPAVALTAFAAVEDRKSALLAGFDSYLSKPVDLGEVVVVVSRLSLRGH